jgi:hypothetical protein
MSTPGDGEKQSGPFRTGNSLSKLEIPDPSGIPALDSATVAGNKTTPGGAVSRRKTAEIYSSGLTNSNPNSRISPAASCRRTFAAIGGVSFGIRLDDAGEGAGTVKYTIWSVRRICVDAMHAPAEPMFNVLVSSMNSIPETSAPRRNTGTCRRIRGALRRCN